MTTFILYLADKEINSQHSDSKSRQPCMTVIAPNSQQNGNCSNLSTETSQLDCQAVRLRQQNQSCKVIKDCQQGSSKWASSASGDRHCNIVNPIRKYQSLHLNIQLINA